jgi:Mg2+/citrate symporter
MTVLDATMAVVVLTALVAVALSLNGYGPR